MGKEEQERRGGWEGVGKEEQRRRGDPLRLVPKYLNESSNCCAYIAYVASLLHKLHACYRVSDGAMYTVMVS